TRQEIAQNAQETRLQVANLEPVYRQDMEAGRNWRKEQDILAKKTIADQNLQLGYQRVEAGIRAVADKPLRDRLNAGLDEIKQRAKIGELSETEAQTEMNKLYNTVNEALGQPGQSLPAAEMKAAEPDDIEKGLRTLDEMEARGASEAYEYRDKKG